MLEQTTRNEKESVLETPVTETFTDKQVPIDKSSPETIPTTLQKKGSGITAPSSAEGREDDIGMIGSSQKTDSRSVAKVTAEEARQRYLKEHFLYIRDIILKNISIHTWQKGCAGLEGLRFLLLSMKMVP